MRKPSMRDILRVGSTVVQVEVSDLLSRKRDRETAHARQCVIVAIRKMTSASLPAIGRLFERDHTTVVHAIQAVEKRNNPDEAKAIDTIIQLVSNPPFSTSQSAAFKSVRKGA